MKRISQLFFQGLLAVMPITLTIYLLYWVGTLAESLLNPVLQFFFPSAVLPPGAGVAAGIVSIFIIGVLLNAYVFQQLAQTIESLITRIPLIKTIYNSIRDIADFAGGSKDGKLQQVVLVQLPNDMKVLGFITQTNIAMGKDVHDIAVYIPLSYQVGGFTIFTSKEKVEFIDMSVKEAMHYTLTAGMASSSFNGKINSSK